MKTRLVSKICGLMLFAPLISIAQDEIEGIVKNMNGEPIPSVKVEIEQTFYKTYTNADGKFEFSKVKPGSYVILFSSPGYQQTTKKVSLNEKKVLVPLEIVLIPNTQMIEEMIVKHVVADDKTPTTYSNLSAAEIEKANYGQDLPYLLQMTPSTVVTSDAGAGVGYTGIRIRGSDPTRTNVTVNGIPINDSESHGVFWVNMPDFASSASGIQVQRGVGTSANGSTAFGASINIKTDQINRDAYGTLDNSYGSFNTLKNTVSAGTGLLSNKFTIDARLSRISSNGYIDRSASDLKSFYLSGAYIGQKTQIRTIVFSGREETYQAWYGTPESVLFGTEADIIAYADRNYIYGADRDSLLKCGRTYNFYTYENEVDNYGQDHYQFHVAHSFSSQLKLTSALHYTYGSGYYEQYRKNDNLSFYGIENVIIGVDTITTSDLIRRKWLDNHFYGGVFALNYTDEQIDMTFGGGINQYLGSHFGEVIWAEFASNSEINDRYYENDAVKTEAHGYIKGTYKKKRTTYYADIQYRHIDYSYIGIDDVNGSIQESEQRSTFDFVNPKAGFMVDLNHRNNIYLSIAMANREPVRQDFVESTPENRPVHEQLMDMEVGYRYKGAHLLLNANGYYINYLNQLILTGAINDVGGYTRTNVENSYRAGIELEAGYRIRKNLDVTGNITLSQNKVNTFQELVDNYDNYDVNGNMIQDTIVHSNTDLAFSPNLIAVVGISYEPLKGLEITFLSKYVGKQFLDNTSNDNRKIDGYFVSNVELNYTISPKFMKEISFGLMLNNVFNEMYANNGYTWGYIAGGTRTVENFYYPQAGRNLLLRLSLKL